MGSEGARGFAEAVKDGSASLRAALEWHLAHNHYPPHPTILIPVAEKAIELANKAWNDDLPEGDIYIIWETQIDLPEGVEFQGSPTVSVTEAIESMHLQAFLDVPEEAGEWIDEDGNVWATTGGEES